MLRNTITCIAVVATAFLAACGTTGGGEATSFSHSCAASCHDAHAANRTAEATSAHAAAGVTCGQCHGDWRHSSCDACHTLGNASTTAINPDSAGVCSTCHAERLGAPHFTLYTSAFGVYPASYTGDRNVNACRNCHDPHGSGARKDILAQYAGSGHGDVSSAAWTLNKWKNPEFAPCQRCHTTRGFIAALTGSSATFGPGSNGVLDCTGCHADTRTYALRTTGAVTAPYAATVGGTMYAAPVAYPDLGASNLCVNCHSGRVGGGVISGIAQRGGSFADIPFTAVNPHNLASAGILLAGIGYQYPGRSYANPSAFNHDRIGLDANPGGKHGPCAGCHMYPMRHTLSPVQKTGETITGIAGTLCVECHVAGNPKTRLSTAAAMEEERKNFASAREVLTGLMESKGLILLNYAPYFRTTDWRTVYPAAPQHTLGAAFNLNLLTREPGAWAHNSVYTKRLLYDSIDWMDNGALDDSVSATLSSLPQTPSAVNATMYFAGSTGTVHRP